MQSQRTSRLTRTEHSFYFRSMERCPTCRTPYGRTAAYHERRVLALLGILLFALSWATLTTVRREPQEDVRSV